MKLAARRGLVRAGDVEAAGLHTQALTRLVREGRLERASRGCYRLPIAEYDLTEHHGLVLAAAVAPEGVVCLLSALQFHVVGTQLPRQLWLALPRGTRPPAIDWPPLRIVRVSGRAYEAGIEEHTLEGQTVRIYDVDKTVVDCFKFRNKIGVDVALEALNDGWRERKLNLNRMAEYARVCRVWNVMRPYLEVISS
ncbi:MAG: type IV toxin-antitoxin system AbiEi family antitoxin domain-containing protein [Candidatus Bipolaricaulota bacterium]